MKQYCLAIILLTSVTLMAQQPASMPLPNRQQLSWHEMEFYLFMHFGPNTFTGDEWGSGKAPPTIFNPKDMDCRQWCRIAKAAGAKAIIITAKHHDGFCLWPSKFSKYTVKETKWKDGDGDVLKELSKACREFGLRFGVYLSPWDRNHPDYGTDKYNDVFVGMLKEVLQNYGPVWELWWDGANGEGPNGKRQVYDWRRFENAVRQYSPKTVIFSDIGPDIRWCGNENGIAGNTNWNFLDTAGYTRGLGAPPTDTLNNGNYNGSFWIPAECDVSIRPGWFFRASENSKVKSAKQLFDIYLQSVGRGANLLLNVPPGPDGLIHELDSASLMGFKAMRDSSFSENLLRQANTYYEFTDRDFDNKPIVVRDLGPNATAYGINLQNFIVQLPQPTRMNCIVLREAIRLGQTIRRFKIVLYNGDKVIRELSGTSVGRKRIVTFPAEVLTSFRVYLADARGNDNISGVAAYLLEEAAEK